MQILELPIGDLKPYARNAKEHPEKQIKKIANSIREFGFLVPILVDKDLNIIAGHGRYIAAQLLGLGVVPTMTADHLTEDQVRAYRLADNKLAESDIDIEIVKEELRLLDLELIDLTGYNANIILDTKEDDPDLSGATKPRSELGDVYELGPHKLICGDSTDEKTYQKLLGDEKARLIFTDPPYSINYASGGGISYDSEKFGGTGGRIFNDDKTPEEALKFYRDVLKQIHAFSTDDVTIYWWYASRLTEINMQALREERWHFSQIILWLKNSLIYSPGQLYHRIYEPCIVAWKQGKVHYQDMTFSAYTELWELDGKTFAEHLDIIYSKRDQTNKYIHPTQKPVRLAERAIKRSSQKDDIVLDGFGGSGSTLIGCDQLGRRARLIELDPKYVDAIVGRWCKFKEDTRVVKNGKEIQWVA